MAVYRVSITVDGMGGIFQMVEALTEEAAAAKVRATYDPRQDVRVVEVEDVSDRWDITPDGSALTKQRPGR